MLVNDRFSAFLQKPAGKRIIVQRSQFLGKFGGYYAQVVTLLSGCVYLL